MTKINHLFAFLAVVSQLTSPLVAQPPTKDQEPSEIAPYTVVKEGKDYEIRSYSPAKWVCRDHMGKSFRNRDQALSFFDLFDYITGQNSAEMKIDMTAPVTVHTQNNIDDEGNSLYKMCFYVPAAHQANPPSPMGQEVYIEDRPALMIASRRFGGFVKTQSRWNLQKGLLQADLKANNEMDFDFDSFYGATYDSPYKFRNRRNEVWLVKLQ